MSPWAIHQAVHALNSGALIAYPTDTIWGFGCHPQHSSAIQRLLSIKKRSLAKGLILLASDIGQCTPFIRDTEQQELAERTRLASSRPITWIVEAHPDCPHWLTGKRETIAIRITRKPLVKKLCNGIQAPLVSTSANLSGRPNARNGLLIRKRFNGLIDYIIEDWDQHSQLNPQARPSEIRLLQTGKILRQ